MKKRLSGCTYASGSFDDQVFYPHPFERLTMITRAKTNKKSLLVENVAENDAAFGGLGREGGYLLPASRAGFPDNGKEACGHAKFVGFNSVAGVATAVKIDPTKEYNPKVKVNLQYTYLVDYQKMILATGNLPGITVTATLDEEGSSVMFTKEKDSLLGSDRLPDDFARGVLYDPTSHFCSVTKLRDRSEEGSTSVSLPEGVNLDTLFAYAFTCRVKGKKTSNSVCILEGDSNRVAVSRMVKDMKLRISVNKSLDKLNALVDQELEARAAARGKEREEAAKAVMSTPASERNRQLDDLLDDLCEDTPGEEAEMTPFAERMHVYGELLGELKQRQKKKAQEAAAIRKAKR